MDWTSKRVAEEKPNINVQFPDGTRLIGEIRRVNWNEGRHGMVYVDVLIYGAWLEAGAWAMNAVVNRLNMDGALQV